MKTPLALAAALLLGLAAAQTGTLVGQDADLARRTLCLDPTSVLFDVPGLNAATMKPRLRADLERRLSLSRVKFTTSDNCDDAFVEVGAEATDASATGHRGVNFEVTVSDYFVTAGEGRTYFRARFWRTGSYGWTTRTGAALEEYILTSTRDLVEDLALAWIKANPTP